MLSPLEAITDDDFDEGVTKRAIAFSFTLFSAGDAAIGDGCASSGWNKKLL